MLRKGVQRHPKVAVAVWLVQLTFPTVALVPVMVRLGNRELVGKYTHVAMGSALVWYACGLVGLCVPKLRQWIVTHTAQIITVYVSSLLGLVGLEAICRYGINAAWAKLPELSPPYTEYSRELGWKPVSGRDGAGAHGWRGPYRTAAKPGGRFRIVCVGDSTTYGLSYPCEMSWPSQLEALLNADLAWTRKYGVTEVINLGGPGYGTDQEFLALKKHGLLFQPDLVIVHLCVNDFADVCNDYNWLMWLDVTRYKPFFELEGDRIKLVRDYAPAPRYASGRTYPPGEKPSLGLWPALLYKIGQVMENGDRRARHNHPQWPIRANFHPEYAKARPLVWALCA